MKVIGKPERDKQEKATESLLKQIINKNFSSLFKELDPQIQKANRTSNYLCPKRPSQRHIALKLPKINGKKKKRILKAAKEKTTVTIKKTSLDYH